LTEKRDKLFFSTNSFARLLILMKIEDRYFFKFWFWRTNDVPETPFKKLKQYNDKCLINTKTPIRTPPYPLSFNPLIFSPPLFSQMGREGQGERPRAPGLDPPL